MIMRKLACSLRSFYENQRDRLFADESGQTMVEYVLMVVLIALVVIVAIPQVTTAIKGAFDKIATELGSSTK
jgi:Flp pilus assembly pilin Flp